MTYHYIDFDNVKQALIAYIAKLNPKKDKVQCYIALNASPLGNRHWISLIEMMSKTQVEVTFNVCNAGAESVDKHIIADLAMDATRDRKRTYCVLSNDAGNDPIYDRIRNTLDCDIKRIRTADIECDESADDEDE